MRDLIDRQAAIDAIISFFGFSIEDEYGSAVKEVIMKLPSAQPERKTGKWILVRGSNGKDFHKCSECLHTQDITGVKNYCAICGAEMEEGERNECNSQRHEDAGEL